MNRTLLTATCLAAALALGACKIVKTPAPGNQTAAADATGDDARIATILTDTYDQKLLPLIREKAVDPPTLRAAIAAGLESAGQAHGHRGAGEGAAWNFAVKGEGKVVAANLQSRARKLDLDTDGDGKADATLQLGPVVKGTALRDFAPFYDFTDFRDQIEFAKLGRALNDKAAASLQLPEGDPTSKTVAFTGVLALKSPTEAWLMTPVEIGAAP